MIMYHLGPQLGVWIMQVSTFSSVLINRFHCSGLFSRGVNFPEFPEWTRDTGNFILDC